MYLIWEDVYSISYKLDMTSPHTKYMHDMYVLTYCDKQAVI